MNEDFIKELLVNHFNTGIPINFKELEHACNTNLLRYKLKTAYRLYKNWNKFQISKITEVDFLSALRTYLLVNQTSIKIPYEINRNNDFGIKKDFDDKYYCVFNTPEYLEEKLTEKAFMRNINNNDPCQPYLLSVSPFIHKLTGFSQYKSLEQKLAVNGALNTPEGYTTLVALPTGGGKSLITQTLAYQEEKGLTIVVVPTVSLAIDQVRAAKENIKHVTDEEIFCYYSGIDNNLKNSLFTCIRERKAKLLFISPEALLRNESFKGLINDANQNGYLVNLVIDEAHIVIEWGDFFRVDYQCLEPWRNDLIVENSKLKTFLLSATFEKDTVKNLKDMFSDKRWIEIRCDELRKEPRFQLVKAKAGEDKNKKIIELIRYLPKPMIIYVTSPEAAIETKSLLKPHGFKNVEMFTGKTKSNQRERIINEWVADEYEIIIATSAFGVGVDKNDIRTVLHLYVPENPNAYYQELGRGGRDSLPSLSIMCIEPQSDLTSTFHKIGKVLTTEKIIGRWQSMYKNHKSTRILDSINIDTSIKPNYNSNDEYSENASTRDIQWNINVLLFLRRNGLIEIMDMIVDEQQKYLIRIKITNDLLYQNTDGLYSMIDNFRNNEWSKNVHDFNVMKNAIKNKYKTCWSEMFYSTYSYVSEYCGGCNNHPDVINLEPNRFPLAKRIDFPIKNDNQLLEDILLGSKDGYYFTNDTDIKSILNFLSYNFDMYITDEKNKKQIQEMHLKTTYNINIIGLEEFAKLYEYGAFFFISGCAIVDYRRIVDPYDVLMKVKKVQNQLGIKVIHVFSEDTYISRKNRCISSFVDGPQIESYMFEEEN